MFYSFHSLHNLLFLNYFTYICLIQYTLKYIVYAHFTRYFVGNGKTFVPAPKGSQYRKMSELVMKHLYPCF